MATGQPTCTVSGSFKGIGNKGPHQKIQVLARPVEFPASYEGNILVADEEYTFLNSDGTFQLELVRNAKVIIEVPRAGIRHQITIPDQDTAELKDLLPSTIIDYSV